MQTMNGWLALIIALLLLAALAIAAVILWRRGGMTARQGRRIGIVEKLPFGNDGHFVLVRRDGMEHFVFVGEGGGFLIEANIGPARRAEPAAPAVPRPAAPQPAPAPQQPAAQPQQTAQPPAAPPAAAAATPPPPQQPAAPRPAATTAPPAPRVPPPATSETPPPPPASNTQPGD